MYNWLYPYKLLLLIAVCSVCHNGGTCVEPEICDCTGGWIGNTCNTGNNETTVYNYILTM